MFQHSIARRPGAGAASNAPATVVGTAAADTLAGGTGDDLLAGLADGRILVSADRGETWDETARVGPITAMAVG